jgi:hypothetical protein
MRPPFSSWTLFTSVEVALAMCIHFEPERRRVLDHATANEYWAAGSDSSAVLLGTTDGGSIWSKVTFIAPKGAPNLEHQSFLGIGGVTCPWVNDCMALGATAQGSPTAPVYSPVVPRDSDG